MVILVELIPPRKVVYAYNPKISHYSTSCIIQVSSFEKLMIRTIHLLAAFRNVNIELTKLGLQSLRWRNHTYSLNSGSMDHQVRAQPSSYEEFDFNYNNTQQ